MAYNRTTFRKILARGLAVTALLCIYSFSILGASALFQDFAMPAALVAIVLTAFIVVRRRKPEQQQTGENTRPQPHLVPPGVP